LPKVYQLETSYGPLQTLADPSPQKIYERVIDIRQSKLPDPKKIGNAGSFFKNPVVSIQQLTTLQKEYPNIPSYPVNEKFVKIPAAWLIDTLRFKGKQVGSIACHDKQPLVLVNLGDGNGSDLITLAQQIMQNVHQHFDVLLENEVRLVGANGIIELTV